MNEISTLLAKDEPPFENERRFGSRFDQFLSRLVPGEPPRDEFDRALLFAALGSSITLVAALVLLAMPAEESIRETGFFAVGRDSLAGIVGFAGSAALPLAALAICLLLLTGTAALTRRLDAAKPALCIAQPIIGVASLAGSGIAWALVIAIVAINLFLWALAIAIAVFLAVSVLIGVLAAAING